MRQLLLVLVSSAVLLSFDLGGRMFITNDEARFPLLARDILEHGQWVMPRLNGVPHVDKPPLQAWLIALASWPGAAVTQASAVVPSLLAALAMVLSTFWIARRLFGVDAGAMAGLVSITMYGVLTLARAPMPDMTFCAALTAAMAAYMAAELDGRRGWLIAFYALVSLAVWTKGPAGLLPLAVVLLDVLTTHGWSGPARLVSAPGLLLFAGLLVPWWALAVGAVGGERFWIDVARNDWLLWYVPTRGLSWQTIASPIAQTITVLLPWSLLLPLACWWAVTTPEPDKRRRLRLLQLWFGTAFVFLAFSHQQRMRYYLVLCPVAALLIAGWYAAQTGRSRKVVFACLWLVSAAGLSLWIVSAGAHENAASGLPAIARALKSSDAPVYAVNVPELVFAFYLDRPVLLLLGQEDLQRRMQDGRGGYFIVANRMLSALPASAGPRLVATGLVNQRPVSVFAVEPSPAHGDDVAVPVRLEKRGGPSGDEGAKQKPR